MAGSQRRRRFFAGLRPWRRNSTQPSYAPSVTSDEGMHTEYPSTSSVESSHSRLDVTTPSATSIDRPATNNAPPRPPTPPSAPRPQYSPPAENTYNNPLGRLSRVSNGFASPILTAFPAPPSYAPMPPPALPPAQPPFTPPQHAVRELPNTGKVKTGLIIGIDFGTTRSGVAFAYISPEGQVREDLISEWPGSGTSTKAKVPTTLYYDDYGKGRAVAWGDEISHILLPNGQPKPDIMALRHFKLHLNSNGKNQNYIRAQAHARPLPPGKTAVEVSADYLYKLRMVIRDHLQKTLGDVYSREENSARYVLTVPAIWDDAAKAATREAALQAGFLKDERDNRLTLISEPEAAATFCAASHIVSLHMNDAILVVDCGGGTVDLISYEVEEEDPFTVAECTEGSGDMCGSEAVSAAFMHRLKKKITDIGLDQKSPRKSLKIQSKCLEAFENRIKGDFTNNGNPWAVDVGIEEAIPDINLYDSHINFTNDEILECFTPAVKRTRKLVLEQIEAVEKKRRHLQNILVVGGFGASTYLFEQLKLHAPPQYQSKVVRPIDAVAAIARGAVKSGLLQRLVTSRVARRHYLIPTVEKFREGFHPERFRKPSADGQDRCVNTKLVLLGKGDRVAIGNTIRIPFYRVVGLDSALVFIDTLYSSDLDECPGFIEEPAVQPLVTLTSDLSRLDITRDGEPCGQSPTGPLYRIHFDVHLMLDGSAFSAQVVRNGEILGQCQARFK